MNFIRNNKKPANKVVLELNKPTKILQTKKICKYF